MIDIKKKVLFTFCSFVILFICIAVKALFIQVIDNEKLKQLSKNQTIRTATTYPNRGSIFDRNGEPLAINNRTYNIFTIPKNFKETQKELKKLKKIYQGFNYNKVVKSIKNRMRYTWVARKIRLTDIQAEEIKRLKTIYIEKTNSRVYPNNELASQILGFVGIDNVGLGGIEFQFDKELRGEAKRIKYIKDAKGRPLRIETTLVETHLITFVSERQAQWPRSIVLDLRPSACTRPKVQIPLLVLHLLQSTLVSYLVFSDSTSNRGPCVFATITLHTNPIFILEKELASVAGDDG